MAAGDPDINGRALAVRVDNAHRAGTDFQPFTLFTPTGGERHADFLLHEQLLLPVAASVSSLYKLHPEAIFLTLRTEEGRTLNVEMLQSHPTADGGNMGYIDATGRHRLAAFDAGVHYQGSIAGTGKSMAALSVFANGDVMLLASDSAGNYVLGKLEDHSGRYILYNDRDMRSHPYSPCGVKEHADVDASQPGTAGKATAAALCNKVMVYWEVAYNLYTFKSSSLVNTQNYVISLFNQVQAMYYNERIAMQLKSMYVWTVPDEFPTNSSNAGLASFEGYWRAVNSGFDGDLAHVIVHDGNGNGGLAALDVLCNHNSGYAYSDIDGSFNAIPTFSWDVEVITHETGHNLGSNHTHWCGWNTGTGGACGAIDNCTTLEAGSSCTTCTYQNDNSAAATAWQGTVMSYCHLTSRGISLANGFGMLPGNLIRTKVSTKTCFKQLVSAKLTPTPICSGNGAIALTYRPDNMGTAPYTYNWSNGTHAQNLSGVSAAGKYSVSVTDSNGCIYKDTAEIVLRPSAGTSNTPYQRMPICCNGAKVPLTLTSTVPQNLTSCQSIYWLHSAFPLTSYADAKTFLDTTAAANVLPSSNTDADILANGAALKVLAPANCTGTTTSYYTPVAVQTPHVADSVVFSALTATSMTASGSTQIGNYVSLPDQTTGPTACDIVDTPTAQLLEIIVYNYTGRPNKMRIVAQDATGAVFYERFAAAGAASYSIPLAGLSGSVMQAMTVRVFDYNCSNTGCASAKADFRLSRKVLYGAHPATLSVACTAPSSLKVSFAPTGCTKLEVPSIAVQLAGASLYPNPTSGAVTVKYATDGRAAITLKVTDMLGKVVYQQEAAVAAGQHEQVINAAGWAKGVYLVNIGQHEGGTERLKLVIE